MEKRTMASSTLRTKRVASKLGLASALLLFACVGAKAQDGPRDSGPADKQTPPALAPGAPAGSYALSGFDNVNLFNGNLNFVLPLVHIGGRGEAAYTIGLALNSKGWNVRRTATNSHNEDVNVFFTPHLNMWNPLDVGYSAGVMVGRHGGEGHLNDTLGGVPQQPCPFKDPLYEYTYTRLTFAMADGTEIEFRDQLTGGQPQAVPFSACFNFIQGFDRGKVFVTFDGTAATFISDSDITDQNVSKFTTFTPSGYLFLANGMRYRIDSGQVSSIEDRNGNLVTFSGPATRVTAAATSFTVTDPLGRLTTIEYNITDPIYGFGDRITYPGFNKTNRVLFIVRTNLADALRSDQTLKNYTDLFPELNGSPNYLPNTFNPQLVASAVYLPDGRRYRFLYNSYAELARVELPSGGAYEYDMTPGSGVVSNAAGPCSEDPEPVIYRRVVTRRTFPDGVNVEGKTTFTENAAAGTVTVDHVDPNQGDRLLTREIHYFNGNAALELFAPRPAFTFWNEGKEYQTDIQDGAGNLLRSTTFHLQQAGPVSWFAQWLNQPIKGTTCYNYGSEPANYPRDMETDTTLADVTPNLVSKETFSYDQFNNVTEKDEFDYGATSPTRATVNTYLTSQTVGGVTVDYVSPNATSPTSTIHLRRLVSSTTVNGVVGGTLMPIVVTNYNYDEDGSSITDAPGILNHNSSYTTSYRPRGNRTSITTAGLTRSSKFDIAGNVVGSTDFNNNLISYALDPTGGRYAFVSTMTFPIADQNGIHASSNALTISTVYDTNTGYLTSFTDPNSQITQFDYTDPLDRLVSIVRPDQSRTTFIYGDTVGDVNLHTIASLNISRNVESYTYFDGLGRAIRSLQFDGTPQTPWIAKDTFYDAMGRDTQVSNPHRVAGLAATRDQCGSCTAKTYDALSRETAVTTPDGATSHTDYGGNTTTTTDPAGVTRSVIHDALNRLVQIIENPSRLNGEDPQITNYAYDVLDDLVLVTQGQQQRFSMYDPLGRLIRSKDPEHDVNPALALADPVTGNGQWSAAYTYTPTGKILSSTDANNITTNYTYDTWDRVTRRSYQNDPANTPQVDWFYDGKGLPVNPSNALGRMTAVSSSVSKYTYDNYTAMGHVSQTTQQIDSNYYIMQYQYDLAGNIISEIYPSQRVVNTAIDAAGRIASVDSPSNITPYADQIQYAPHGDMMALQLGNGLWEHIVYDRSTNGTSQLGRFQPTEIGLGTTNGASDVLNLRYDYGTSNNNGNVLRHIITAPGTPGFTLTQQAQYDAFNRLAKVQEVAGDLNTWQGTAIWEEDFTYDRYGNRTGITATPQSLLSDAAPAVDPATNRFNASGFRYDAVGNLKQQVSGGMTQTYIYNADNHLISAQQNGSQLGSYFYDGLDHRVKKIDSTRNQTTIFIYDTLGRLVAEYSNTVTPNNGSRYLTQDLLESNRVVTGSDQGVVARYDLLPFGALLPTGLGGRDTVTGYNAFGVIRQLFTGKERDQESGLDYFGARYDSTAQGRFTSPDVRGADQDPANPQTWNLYTYAHNSPLRFVDKGGTQSQDQTQPRDRKLSTHGARQAVREYKQQVRRDIAADRGTPRGQSIYKTNPGAAEGGQSTLGEVPAGKGEDGIRGDPASSQTASTAVAAGVGLLQTVNDNAPLIAQLMRADKIQYYKENAIPYDKFGNAVTGIKFYPCENFGCHSFAAQGGLRTPGTERVYTDYGYYQVAPGFVELWGITLPPVPDAKMWAHEASAQYWDRIKRDFPIFNENPQKNIANF